jgi:hypothetical protein
MIKVIKTHYPGICNHVLGPARLQVFSMHPAVGCFCGYCEALRQKQREEAEA